MNVIECIGFGSPEVLHLRNHPRPTLYVGGVLIKVAAAGLNRADLLQRQGKYPPPSGASDILGMEVSGIVVALGDHTQHWQIGDRVCALLVGGGYAEYVVVPQEHCLPIPPSVSMIEAAALPEALVTVYANVFLDGAFQKDQTALIHGGSSGIGTTAIQMIKSYGGKVFVTAGSAEKAAFCQKLGADLAINYKQEDFVATILAVTGERGVNLVLDMIGGDYINRNLRALSAQGRHVSIATQSGAMATIDMRLIMQKHLILTGSTLRGRSHAEKASLIAAVKAQFWPLVAVGHIKPFIYQCFPLEKASEAHKVMESAAHIGKIVLEVSKVGALTDPHHISADRSVT